MRNRTLPFALAIAGALVATTAAHAQGYSFRTIAPPPGVPAGASLFISGYTDNGLMVVGAQVSGVSYDFTAVDDLYDAKTNTYTALPAAPGAAANSTIMVDINDAGTMVGYYHPDGATWQAFTYSGGVFTNLNPPGGPSTNAYGISNNGQIVGSVGPGDFSTVSGFLLSSGSYQTINAAPSPANSTGLFAINDSGAMVGAEGPSSAENWTNYFLDVGGTLTPITMPGEAVTEANDLNDAGTIVGGASNDGFITGTGFIDKNGVFTEVTVPGAVQTFVTDINDLGDINGTYLDASGNEHLFIGLPVPEPGSWTMLAAGLLGLGALRRSLRRPD